MRLKRPSRSGENAKESRAVHGQTEVGGFPPPEAGRVQVPLSRLPGGMLCDPVPVTCPI